MKAWKVKAAQIKSEVAMCPATAKHQAQADKETAIGYRQVDQGASSTSKRPAEQHTNVSRGTITNIKVIHNRKIPTGNLS